MSESKAIEIKQILGEFVSIQLKNISIIKQLEDGIELKTTYEGYLVDVTENYLYLGPSVGEYSTMLDINELGIITIIEDVPEELNTFVGDESVH